MSEERQFPSLISPAVDFGVNPEDHIAFTTADGVAEVAKRLGRKIHGQLSIEDDGMPGGFQVLFCAYPDGEFYIWFIEALHFVLIAYIGSKAKTLSIQPIQSNVEFQAAVNDIANKLNLRHGYSIDEPDDFKPSATQDNPAE